MESNITIKATATEMDNFFNNNSVCSVRYFEQIGNGKYKATIRHEERENRLRGIYTIAKIIAELSEEKDNAVVWYSYLQYLRDWVDSHTAHGFYGMTPACFDEWHSCEYQKNLSAEKCE